MTKEEFFEEYVDECFEDVGSNLKDICETIRKYECMEEEDFYQELYDYCSGANYSVLSGFNMFTDSVDMETMLDMNSDILNWKIVNKIYQKATQDTRTLMEACNEEDSDFILELHSILIDGYYDLTKEEQESFGKALFHYMIDVYENLASVVLYAPSEEKDNYGNKKYYIIVSDYVEFDI